MADAGFDGGVPLFSIANARQARFCTQSVHLTGAVVTAVQSAIVGSSGNTQLSFWVADPSAPKNGINVFKFFNDLPTNLTISVGDILNIDAVVGAAPSYVDQDGYRLQLQGNCGGQQTGPMTITVTGHVSPLPDTLAPSPFGVAADGGPYRANPDFAGARVNLPGPLTLVDAFPAEMHRLSNTPSDPVYYGFRVAGPGAPQGVLIRNEKTYGPSPTDGGQRRCDWRALAASGKTVTFPSGIRGVWDTYTNAPCADGGIDGSCFRNAGTIPGAGLPFTYVLFPQDCDTDFAGADAGP